MGAKRQHLCVVRSNSYTDDGPMAICGEYFKAETFPLTLHAYKNVMTIYKCTCSHAACFRFAHMGARALSNDLLRIHRYCWRDTFSFKWKKTGINHLQSVFYYWQSQRGRVQLWKRHNKRSEESKSKTCAAQRKTSLQSARAQKGSWPLHCVGDAPSQMSHRYSWRGRPEHKVKLT